MKQETRIRLIGGVGGAVLTAMLRTLRWEVTGREHYDSTWGVRRPVIFVLWHGRLLPSSFYHRDEELATLISQHRDGDYIARVVESWGFRAIRGSSTRGGSAALRAIVRTLRGGTAVAITPDGPQGPRQKMKSGPVLAAQVAGVPIIPVSAGGAGWTVGGWDRFLIPRPFARIRLAYGEPVVVPRDADAAELERISDRLERRLNQLTDEVDRASANGARGPDRSAESP